jgi:hypothetical protein
MSQQTELQVADGQVSPVSAAEHYDLVIRGRRVLTTAGISAREVGVRGGKVVALPTRLGSYARSASAMRVAVASPMRTPPSTCM